MFSEMFITCTTKGSDSIYICKYIDLGGEGRHWFYTLEMGCPLSQPFPQPAWSVIYHFLQLMKRCQFSWTVHVGWYMNMIHLTHPCIILPFVQCSCDLSPMLCGKFPVTLIVTAWEQLPTIGNSQKDKQVRVWARSDPAGCEKIKEPFWKVSPKSLHLFHTGHVSCETGYKWISTSLGASRLWRSCVQKRQKYSKRGACLMLLKYQVRLCCTRNTHFMCLGFIQ